MAMLQSTDGVRDKARATARNGEEEGDRDRDRDRHTGRDRTRRVRRRAEPRGSSASASSLDDDDSSSSGKKLFHSRGEEKVTVAPEGELDAAALRRIRIDRLEGRRHLSSSSAPLQTVGRDVLLSSRTTTLTDTMTTESHATLRSSRKDGGTEGHRRRGHRDEEKRQRRKKREDEGEAQYVYGAPVEKTKAPTVRVSETRRLGRDGEESEEEEIVQVTRSRTVKEKPKERKIKVVYMTRDEMKASKHKEPRVKTVKEDRPRESGPSTYVDSSTTLRSKTCVEEKQYHEFACSVYEVTYTIDSRDKSNSETIEFYGVECLTCLSDDIPRSKSAKLKCGHRMCHSCLKRIFRLSVNDPQHMPPKCCTADHIPLKHVEKLFDINFKKNWNRKFQEFSTKNRIYCPARRCGEWIKPGNMHKEDGRKYGKCGRCKTKVCCLCNGKWHGAKDCPKDEETNKLLETAKQAGWQRCYNCRTMVELKEGCNHMTCRCTAEFCMICGLKWKSCNCPWFNYEAVEEDRLNHMQVPRDIVVEAGPAQNPEDRPRRVRRPRPATYHEEITDRQRQERRDEALARRTQRAALNEIDDDYQGGIGDIHGVGNGAAHFMNQDYVRAAHNILTGNFDQANAAANYVMGVANARAPPGMGRRMNDRYPAPPPPPPPMLRRHTMREQEYNDALPRQRAAERIVPRRTRTDYEAEAAVHAPLGRNPPRPVPPQPPRGPRVERAREGRVEREPRPSVLAGLGGRGNRVSAWRSHVEPGVEPEEGVLSMVP
ncbi:hypothetical protein ACEPPN_001532 [Leptodophora sp. 'Broadleaf-Isolate-01']